MKIAVVGCGFAGSAAALFLSRSGHDVCVYEAVPKPGAIGAGIIVQPPGMQVLAELGLLEATVQKGAILERLHCVKGNGQTLIDLRYSAVGPRLFGLGIHRGTLFSILYAAVQASPARVRTDARIVDTRTDGPQTWVIDDKGEAHGPHDLVVVADGARSQLRHLTNSTVKEYPWGALWFVAKDPERVYTGGLYQVVRGTHQLLGFLPTGIPPGPDSDPVVSMFWSVRNDRIDEWKQNYESWRAHILKEDPRSAFILDQIDGPDALLFSRYHDVVMRPWHTKNVVFIGDAAHATSPQLGQGTNLGLYDARVLGTALGEPGDLSDQLSWYSRQRRAHLNYYQWATRWLTPFFQSDYTLLGPLRDFAMPIAVRVPYIRDQMIWSMVGTKTGIVRKSLPTPQLPKQLPSSTP